MMRSRKTAEIAGFTMVELIVVLLIVGIIAAFIAPRSANESLILTSQAEQIAGDIRYVQSLAMTQGQRFRINFTPAVSPVVYQFTFANGVVATHPMVGPTSVALNPLVTATISPSSNMIGFDGQGTPYTDAAVSGTPLAAQASIQLTLNGETKTVTIQPQTGLVR